MGSCIVDSLTLSGDLSKSGGTANQFLKANGTLDSMKYISPSGQNYIIVEANDTEYGNGFKFQAAHDTLLTSTPFGSALSSTNRATIILSPGTYDYEWENSFFISGSYIDVVSLDGQCSVNLLTPLVISTHDTYYCGINNGNNGFKINSACTNNTYENCIGGSTAFTLYSAGKMTGNFINCKAGNNSFNPAIESTAKFINCSSGSYSFGSGSTSHGGYYYNCSGYTNCFGGAGSASASGIYENCKAGNYSFGISQSFGTFLNCIAGYNSFGSSNAYGTCINCTAGDSSFGGSNESAGKFINCKAGNTSFGYSVASGSYIYCQGGDSSFGEYIPDSGFVGTANWCTITGSYEWKGSFTEGGCQMLCINPSGSAGTNACV